MSAPMNNFAGEFEVEVEECKNIPEELDLTSVNLNPLKVLYCENVHLPHNEPTTYNNLAEYENVVIRGNVPKLAKSAASRRGRGRGKQHIESRSRVSILQSQKKVDSDSSGNDEAMTKLIERKKKMNRNVMNRMTSYDKGPFTLLRRAVEEQVRVKVWMRSAVTRRGYCLAYVIAFDKHFNLALMDVDETYRIPRITRKPPTDTNAVNEQEGENKRSEKLQSSVYPIRENVIVSKYDSEDTDSSVTKLTQKLSLYNTNKQAVDSENISNTTSTSIVASRISHQAETLKDKPTQNTTDIKDLTGSKLTDTEEQSKHSSQVTLKTATTGEQKTEEECITIIQYKTKHRHANQLFVRGDNVVSVVLLD